MGDKKMGWTLKSEGAMWAGHVEDSFPCGLFDEFQFIEEIQAALFPLPELRVYPDGMVYAQFSTGLQPEGAKVFEDLVRAHCPKSLSPNEKLARLRWACDESRFIGVMLLLKSFEKEDRAFALDYLEERFQGGLTTPEQQEAFSQFLKRLDSSLFTYDSRVLDWVFQILNVTPASIKSLGDNPDRLFSLHLTMRTLRSSMEGFAENLTSLGPSFQAFQKALSSFIEKAPLPLEAYTVHDEIMLQMPPLDPPEE